MSATPPQHVVQRAADAARWEARFAQLVAFQARTGHCRVTRSQCDGDPGFFNWVITQRQEQRRGRIAPDREARLTSLGFKWSQSRRSTFDFDRFYAALAAYKAAHGHPNLPLTYYQSRDPDWSEASLWFHYLRRGALDNRLSPAQRQRLVDLGVTFEPTSRRDRGRWEIMLARYQALAADPQADPNAPEHAEVRHWVHVQRSCYRLGKMSPRRVAHLRDLGFPLEAPTLAVSRHYHTYGQLSLLARSNIAMIGTPLGHWIRLQRQRKAAGTLPPEELAALEAIRFDWTAEALRDRVVRQLGLVYLLYGTEILLSVGKEALLVAHLEGVASSNKPATQHRYLRQVKLTLEQGLPEALLDKVGTLETALPAEHLARYRLPAALRALLLRGEFRCRADLAGLSLGEVASRCGVTFRQVADYADRLRALGVVRSAPAATPHPTGEILSVDWTLLGFSVRLKNCLLRAGIHSLEALQSCDPDELLRRPGFGRHCLDELRGQLARLSESAS